MIFEFGKELYDAKALGHRNRAMLARRRCSVLKLAKEMYGILQMLICDSGAELAR